MTRNTKLSSLDRLDKMASTPHLQTAARNETGRPIVRYTAEIPKALHRALKVFAMDHDTTTYAVTNALFTLLVNDEEVAEKVRQVLSDG